MPEGMNVEFSHELAEQKEKEEEQRKGALGSARCDRRGRRAGAERGHDGVERTRRPDPLATASSRCSAFVVTPDCRLAFCLTED